MTATGQNFGTFSGNSVQPIFTVRDAAGVAIDLSGVQEILWAAQRSLQDAVVVSKSYSANTITLPNGGGDGKFKVLILPGDTQNLTGNYIHQAIVTDSVGNVSTVELGMMAVGRMPAWTYSGDPCLSKKDAVRFYIGDTDPNAPQLTDPEILYQLTIYNNPMLAASVCARALATKYARKVNKRVGDLSINYSDIGKQYAALADELESRGETFGILPYSGGTSVQDIINVDLNCNRPKPPFTLDQFQNWTGPYGQQWGWGFGQPS